MVNYTLGDGFGKVREFEVRSGSGEVCIAGELDFETRSVYEFPVIATDRGGLSTTAMVKIQLTDVNDNQPSFYPREYNVSLREGGGSSSSSSPVVVVVATDLDSGPYGSIKYRIVAGNEGGLFRIDHNTGEIFVTRPSLLSTRTSPYHRLNISATDGGGLRSFQDAEVFLSVTDSAQRPPIFERPRYTFAVKEDVGKNTIVGSVKATSSDSGSRSSVRYSIYSGDPDGYFSIDPVTGTIRTASGLDHEAHQSVLLNVQATSGDPPAYGHTQVNIGIEDVNDNAPEFDSSTVRISVPENVELGIPLYAAHARDRDSGRNGVVRYRLASSSGGVSSSGGLFAVDPRLGHLTLSRHLDYETAQRHSLVVIATDTGEPPLSANLTVLVEVQDVNDNRPVFERAEYTVDVLESLPVNSQVLQVTAVDLDTGNNARLTYRLLSNTNESQHDSKKPTSPAPSTSNNGDGADGDIFGIFPNSGWIYLRQPLNRESRDHYVLTVAATDNGTPAGTATSRVSVNVMDANDNDPTFTRESYEFSVEENLPRGALVGKVAATDADLDVNAAVRYSLIPSNTSFQINPLTGEIVTREPLDRETKAMYEIVAEARDQGVPPRSARVAVRVAVTDVNDNSPELVDPQEDVISVREEQPPGTEVVRVRAVDRDEGNNASVTYSILKGRDSDGYGVFTVDPVSGLIRTRAVLDHEDRAIYRLGVAATDSGKPPRQTVRLLRVEVLDLNDNRPTFTSSSLVFRVKEDVKVGHIVGTVAASDASDGENLVTGRGGSHVTYTLTSLTPGSHSSHNNKVGTEVSVGAFDIDRSSGSLVVARELDREVQSEYRLEVRALDTSASNNPQSSAVSVRVDVADVNDNAPHWPEDPVIIPVPEDTPVGSAVWNFTASDADAGSNGELRYSLVKQWPNTTRTPTFTVDPLTGTLTLHADLDYEVLPEYTLIVRATDQASNKSERLSTSVTARVMVQDANDNVPVFVSPATSTVLLSDSVTVGSTLCHVIAVDKDFGENGRVTYVIASGNQEGKFSLSYDTGVLTLARSLVSVDTPGSRRGSVGGGRYTLNVTATDHGAPAPRHTTKALHLIVQGTKENPPRFLHSLYHANVSEDAAIGSYVAKVMARSAMVESGNLTYHVPAGIADDRFSVEPHTGVVSVRALLDRETRDRYLVPVYVTSPPRRPGSPQFDVTTVAIRVTDVNDHAPEFRPGTCYTVAVPENSDLAVIHTVVATDLDSGPNGEVTYSITAGNIGNKFSIDLHTGELTARPLDRESHSRYWLVITAQDRGTPVPLQGSCNVSVIVEDQNDNDPRFSQPRYTATIPENVPVDSVVLTVQASDADLGVNARIVYSLANESQWLFKIDNKSGVITTAGLFDHERQSVYNFQVVATDGGRYDARSQKVPVQITIGDVNDNKPVFSRFPFSAEVPAYTQPGHNLMRVTAEDQDEGTNAEIVFSFVNEPLNNKFRINPNTGIVTAASSLAMESGKLFHLEVLARDKGNPPQSATGLIEIKVGESPEGASTLRFQNASYVVHLPENAPVGRDVIQVAAVRTDGRRHRITYSFGSGNEDSTFEMSSQTGQIRVRDPRVLDYETRPTVRLVVVAQTESLTSGPPLYGYCDVWVHLQDQNDNAPRFTQQQYSAAVWEGNNKGTFVMQVSATDADQGANSRVLYHIVDGNHDNAFVIEPPFSGLVKTNIVLDREIRDTYRLTVIATDEGTPQLTGTSTLRINIVDVNDNQPTFPPHSIISVSEGTEVGTVLTAVTANDVDTNPSLTYGFSADNDGEGGSSGSEASGLGVFSIDRFSGKVTLARRLDFETRREYRLRVTASDTAHAAHTVLTIRVTDVNDNAPIFMQPSYQASLPGGDPAYAILTVNATDADAGDNAKVHYSLLTPVKGFTVDQTTGTLYANRTGIPVALMKQDIQLVIVATDAGNPPLSSSVAVRIHVNDGSNARPRFAQDEYRVHLREDSPCGTTVAKIAASEMAMEETRNVMFSIYDGNVDGSFQVMSPSGDLVLIKALDRETEDSYTLRVVAGEPNSPPNNATAVLVHVMVDDANDNSPVFQSSGTGGYDITVSEGASLGHSILKVTASDADQAGGPNAELVYDITSGNDRDLFALDPQTGVLSVKRALDYDAGVTEYMLVVRASDSAKLPIDAPLSTVTSVHIRLKDENDNAPRFPVSEYLEFVGENEHAGTAVFTARATDLDKGIYGKLNYSIVSADVEDSWKLFRVDAATGLVTTDAEFDYESRNRYAFTLRASDVGGKTASVRVRVEVESRDEFHPQFTERTYRFVLAPASGHLPVGYVVGHVAATDRDKGPDGRVVYQLTTQHPYFKVNRTTGAVMVKKKLDGAALEAGRDISLVVTASSGRQGSLTNMTVVELALDPLADHGTNLASSSAADAGGNNTTLASASGGLADWALGLLIALILVVLAFGAVFLFLHMRNRRQKKVNKPALSAGAAVGSPESFVDPGAFDTIPIRGGGAGGGVQGPAAQFGPPKYDEIPPYVGGPVVHRNNNSSSSNSGAATTSELSGSEQSGSSGRGSAEDGEDVEDEEIRMINEGPLQRDSGIHRQTDDVDDDNLSDVSVHNTQEYLARLGIVDTGGAADAGAGKGVPMHMFDEEGGGEADITNLIYAKLNDVGASERGSSAEDGGGASGGVLCGFGEVSGVAATHQPSMTGSLSSIVHSEEELTGSYNWDYLLDWGPQYQPLAHVFSEIARLKDDTASVQSTNSGASSGKGKAAIAPHPPVVKTVPPPLLTSVAPRSIAAPVLASRSAGGAHSASHHGAASAQGSQQLLMLPRSPISHDASGAGFSTSTAMSPSFSPSLSPLATRSPSISPLVTPGVPTAHHVRQAQQPQRTAVAETELRI
ncbi:protein dachsous-like isoform X2 [Periplaneta americana]|uniref:protein dachsous-like isoform X2 n=1 Tax=Periplaneta americana TaxID=6978 RepID=UPI0037E7FCD1